MIKKEFQLLVATYNRGKIQELTGLLKDLPVRLFGLQDFEKIAEVEETGQTFADNASLKAQGYARQTGLWALSDDSGLEVEALGNLPGVFSARYAGENASDDEKTLKLLRELKNADQTNRSARFVCSMAVADDQSNLKFLAEGICRGKIAAQPRGTNGFGYDPIFVPEGFDKTFGELSANVKHKISHRALAFAKIIRFLRDLTAV